MARMIGAFHGVTAATTPYGRRRRSSRPGVVVDLLVGEQRARRGRPTQRRYVAGEAELAAAVGAAPCRSPGPAARRGRRSAAVSASAPARSAASRSSIAVAAQPPVRCVGAADQRRRRRPGTAASTCPTSSSVRGGVLPLDRSCTPPCRPAGRSELIIEVFSRYCAAAHRVGGRAPAARPGAPCGPPGRWRQLLLVAVGDLLHVRQRDLGAASPPPRPAAATSGAGRVEAPPRTPSRRGCRSSCPCRRAGC